MDPVNDPSLDEITRLYAAGMIGFKESRDLIAVIFPVFATVRDEDLDRQLDEDDEDHV